MQFIFIEEPTNTTVWHPKITVDLWSLYGTELGNLAGYLLHLEAE